jgi:hypothetical protein
MYTLQGKPDTHATYASCAGPRMPFIRFSRTVPVRDNLSRWPNRVGQNHCSWEKVLLTSPLSLAEWHTGPTSVSLPNTTIEAVRLSQTSIDEQATRLTGHISPAYDQYVQYLLMGVNPSALNRLRRWLQPWRCQLFTLHSPTFPTDGPPLFQLRILLGLRLSNLNISLKWKWCEAPIANPWPFNHSTSIKVYIYA